MNGALLVLVLLELAAVLALAVVLAAMLRSLTHVRADVDAVRAQTRDPFDAGLPVGSAVPDIQATALDGSAYTGDRWRGSLRLVAFAHPGCPPCDDLIPDMIRGCEDGSLPPAIVISRGRPSEHPAAWRSTAGRADLVMERSDDVARRFDAYATPQVFVVTPEDRIGARGIATTVAEVSELVAASRAGSRGSDVADRK